MRIADRLPWRDRLKAAIIILALLAALYWLTACGGEPPDAPPDTQPATARYALFVPFARWDYHYEGGKAGVAIIAYGRRDPASQAWWSQPTDVETLGAGWWYNWSHLSNFGGDTPQTVGEFVPMVWKRIPGDLVCPRGGAPLLWLNEPDLWSQANITPAAAVELLIALSERCPDARLIGPQMSSERHAFTWLASFWELWADTGRPFTSTLGVHIYNHPRPAEWIDAIYATVPGYDGTVWVTEFGYCGPGDRPTIFANMIRAFERDERVERYAPFANRISTEVEDFAWLACASLFDEAGAVTGMGRVYQDEAATRPRPGTQGYP